MPEQSITYEIKHRFSGKVIWSGTIEIDDEAPERVRIGRAVIAALAEGADLCEADLCEADLREANLRGADLSWANLRGADLCEADLSWANLREADLSEANLSWANLREADLSWANLRGAANMREVKAALFDSWPVVWTQPRGKNGQPSEAVIQIGCQRHPVSKWREADDRWIAKMDPDALAWWKKHRDLVFMLVETSPAVPYGKPEKDAEAEANNG